MNSKTKILLFSACVIATSSFASDFIAVSPNENFKSVIDRLGEKKNTIYNMEFDDFELKNQKELKIKSIEELLDYIKNTNGYTILAENKNKSKYKTTLPIILASNDVPKKVEEVVAVVEEVKKEPSILNFNQLYIFINNNHNAPVADNNATTLNSETIDNYSKDVNYLKQKIFDLAKENNKIDLLFLNERLRDINDLESVKKLVKELERI